MLCRLLSLTLGSRSSEQKPGQAALLDDKELAERQLTRIHDLKGEHQHAEYMANLDLDPCAQTLTAIPGGLLFLALRRKGGRSGSGERRRPEDVIRIWKVRRVLSCVEPG